MADKANPFIPAHLAKIAEEYRRNAEQRALEQEPPYRSELSDIAYKRWLNLISGYPMQRADDLFGVTVPRTVVAEESVYDPSPLVGMGEDARRRELFGSWEHMAGPYGPYKKPVPLYLKKKR